MYPPAVYFRARRAPAAPIAIPARSAAYGNGSQRSDGPKILKKRAHHGTRAAQAAQSTPHRDRPARRRTHGAPPPTTAKVKIRLQATLDFHVCRPPLLLLRARSQRTSGESVASLSSTARDSTAAAQRLSLVPPRRARRARPASRAGKARAATVVARARTGSCITERMQCSARSGSTSPSHTINLGRGHVHAPPTSIRGKWRPLQNDVLDNGFFQPPLQLLQSTRKKSWCTRAHPLSEHGVSSSSSSRHTHDARERLHAAHTFRSAPDRTLYRR